MDGSGLRGIADYRPYCSIRNIVLHSYDFGHGSDFTNRCSLPHSQLAIQERLVALARVTRDGALGLHCFDLFEIGSLALP